MPLNVPLKRVTAMSVDEVGAKAAILARLAEAGVAVPPTVVITTAAYDHFIRQGRLTEYLAPLVSSNASVAERAEAHAALRAANVPSAVFEAVEAGLAEAEFARDLVAVRASPLPHADATGLYRGALDVLGLLAVVDRVKAVWVAGWAAPAVAYRTARGLGLADARLAVLVQAMVDASAAGTATPAANGQLHVTAVPGVGADWATVTADQWVLDGRGTIAEVALQDPQHPAATPAVLAAVAHLVQRVADVLGGPRRVTWAWDGEALWTLHARPLPELKRHFHIRPAVC